MQLATAKWYDRREYVFIEFCVENSKDVEVKFEKLKLVFSCVGGTDDLKHQNDIDLFETIDPKCNFFMILVLLVCESKHRRTDRSVFCCLLKMEPGKSWPRLTKAKAKLNWLSVDFSNWKDWEDDSDEEPSSYDRFSEMMNDMGGDEELAEDDGVEDDSTDSDDEKMPDLE